MQIHQCRRCHVRGEGRPRGDRLGPFSHLHPRLPLPELPTRLPGGLYWDRLGRPDARPLCWGAQTSPPLASERAATRPCYCLRSVRPLDADRPPKPAEVERIERAGAKVVMVTPERGPTCPSRRAASTWTAFSSTASRCGGSPRLRCSPNSG